MPRSSTGRDARANNSPAPDRAIAAADFAAALDALSPPNRLAVAVSGGADSLALLQLTCAWAKARKIGPVHAVTVDHGLRTGSRREALLAGRIARAMGAKHRILTWAGAKPSSDVQAAARQARYRLIGAWARGMRLEAVLTGHTLDDLAETFLINLARGSGLDGLSALAPRSVFPVLEFSALALLRPLLGFQRTEIEATLRSLGQTWIDDPSNAQDRFQRVRIRALMPALSDAGITPQRLARTATHLARARHAIEAATRDILVRCVKFTGHGAAIIDPLALKACQAEPGLRALAALLKAIGGGTYGPRFESLDAVWTWLADQGGNAARPARGRSVGGCRLVKLDGKVVVFAEMAALKARDPEIPFDRTRSLLWDNRFWIGGRTDQGGTLRVRRLDLARARRAGLKFLQPQFEPNRSSGLLPALWQGETIVAIPRFVEPGQPRPSDREPLWCQFQRPILCENPGQTAFAWGRG